MLILKSQSAKEFVSWAPVCIKLRVGFSIKSKDNQLLITFSFTSNMWWLFSTSFKWLLTKYLAAIELSSWRIWESW